MKPLFITGIGTDVGKTLDSAILVEKFKYDYWKPIQSGDLDNSDTVKVKRLVSNKKSAFHPEAYRLTQPFSPHKSADLDGIEIDFDNINLPETDNQLLIEGAGGLMAPLNQRYFVIDLIEKLNAEAILVVKNYLGSINHTLLSLELLKYRKVPLKGIIFNGDSDPYSESLIINYSQATVLGRIPFVADMDKTAIIDLGRFLY